LSILFLDAHAVPPPQTTLDLDATDDPLHGHQEGRFFHGYYDNYCYLPLYVFCGRHLLASKLRPANINGTPAAPRRWRGSSPTSAPAGRRCAFCCAPIRALLATG
jgi:Transposase DDE domain group 1